MNSNALMKSYIIQCRTLCKIPGVNWLIIGDVVRVSKIDHQFFSLFFFTQTWYKSYRDLKLPLGQYGHAGLDSTSAVQSCMPLRTPPLDFCTVIVHEIILSKITIPTGLISDKKAQCNKRGLLKLFYESDFFKPIVSFKISHSRDRVRY